MNNPMIPSLIWAETNTEKPNTEVNKQELLCIYCLQVDPTLISPPNRILMINGSSFCVSHALSVLTKG